MEYVLLIEPINQRTHGWGADANDGTHHSIARVLLDQNDFNFIFIGDKITFEEI